MKSRILSIAKFSWEQKLSDFFPKSLEKTIISLEKIGIYNCSDLAWTLPLRIFPFPNKTSFNQFHTNEFVSGNGTIAHRNFKPLFYRKFKSKILLHNGLVIVQDELSNQTINLRFFNLYPSQKKVLENLHLVSFMGKCEDYQGSIQIVNPKISAKQDNLEINHEAFIKEYPTLNKIPGNTLKKMIEKIPLSAWEFFPSIIHHKNSDSISMGEALQICHGLVPFKDWNQKKHLLAKERLIYEEFFTDQLKIKARKTFLKTKAAPLFTKNESLFNQYLKLIPFQLTKGQLQSLSDIFMDFSHGHPMMRMLQGDVGCGKTLVAFLSSLVVISQNGQVALMCPTEALAQQHLKTFNDYFSSLGISTSLLLGSQKADEKKKILSNLKSGNIQFVIGTHALFQDKVQFKNLQYIIIDEQHKFGVEQRLSLSSKGKGTHCLLMSATPIPRTLSLTYYGDLDFSTIREIPEGRSPIKTRIVEKINYEKYLGFLKTKLNDGAQGYFVFPVIEESETHQLLSAQMGFERYKKLFPEFKLALLHGQLKNEEKDLIIKQFHAKKIQILCSTTVIEVGINVPDATFISIYHPERFGLSSLHQLRGRVGRGSKQGYCFLVLEEKISEKGLDRLKKIEETLDGFKIAQLDLDLRGEGDLFGVDQSGTETRKRIAHPTIHYKILDQAYRDVEKLFASDPSEMNNILRKIAQDQKILDTI